MRVNGDDPNAARNGVFAMIACCAIWGLSPLFYRLLNHIDPADVLAHRTVWSLVFFTSILLVQRRLGALAVAVSNRRQIGWVVLAAVMISINWFLFIVAVQIDRVTETSLGYYIFPLVSVLFGYALFRERLRAFQWVAVALAALAVVVLTVGLGAPPWISLVLATTFGIYGVLKKRVAEGPVVSVTAEVLVLVPLALIWLAFFAGIGWPDAATLILLILTGPMTAMPLMLFSYAAKRVRLATVGILQFINPTLQFLLAVMVFGEPIGLPHMVAFPLIWVAVAIYSWIALAEDRAARTASARSATVGTG